MNDYIRREDALDNIVINYEISANDCCRILCDCLYKMTKHMIPAADVVEQKHGRWVKDNLASTNGDVYPVVHCSECNIVGYWEPNYCPNCGARMDGDS